MSGLADLTKEQRKEPENGIEAKKGQIYSNKKDADEEHLNTFPTAGSAENTDAEGLKCSVEYHACRQRISG